MMIDTSLDAWAEVKKTLSAREKLVYDALSEIGIPRTAPELARYMNLPLRSVAPRITGLKKKGMVERYERRICHVTKGSAYSWKVAPK